MDDTPTYTEKLRRLVPLTPAGLSAYGRAGWRVILAELWRRSKPCRRLTWPGWRPWPSS